MRKGTKPGTAFCHVPSITVCHDLADDDNDATDNRATTNAFRVK
jgi:hypothetical protein